MRIGLVRNATLIVELGGHRILVDPMLDDMGARPAVDNTPNPAPNPTARLPFPAEQAVEGLDAVLVTHRHQDHLDTRAIELIPRRLPVFCQPEDGPALRELGLDARPVAGRLDWDGLAIERVPAQHGHGAVADALAPVSGFVLGGELYIAGDTVWYEEVARTIARLQPRVAVVNAGGARFVDSDLIIMGIDDVREMAARVPTVVAVHLEALNHCLLTRAELRAALPGVHVPEDGETVDL
jgi:L-ascorbate metabolism protein UlaG (beta-lactamase superfamily)